jgi:putative addiction module killer protein
MKFEILKSGTFDAWLSGLRDRQAKVRVAARIDRLAQGNPGDMKGVGSGVTELRIDYGPGYRVYYKQYGTVVILLLCGGDKESQDTDIKRAIEIGNAWKKW